MQLIIAKRIAKPIKLSLLASFLIVPLIFSASAFSQSLTLMWGLSDLTNEIKNTVRDARPSKRQIKRALRNNDGNLRDTVKRTMRNTVNTGKRLNNSGQRILGNSLNDTTNLLQNRGLLNNTKSRQRSNRRRDRYTNSSHDKARRMFENKLNNIKGQQRSNSNRWRDGNRNYGNSKKYKYKAYRYKSNNNRNRNRNRQRENEGSNVVDEYTND